MIGSNVIADLVQRVVLNGEDVGPVLGETTAAIEAIMAQGG